MGEGIKARRYTGGGNIINGIIKEYYAHTSQISANTFVEFIEGGTSTKGSDIQIGPSYSSSYVTAVVLSNSKVLFLYSTKNYGDKLYGIFLTINDTTITAGNTITIINTSKYALGGLQSILLNDNKILVIHNYDYSKYLYGTILSVNNDVITVDTDVSINTSSNIKNILKIIRINNNKVFIAGNNDTSRYSLSTAILTINGNTITSGNELSIDSSNSSIIGVDCILLDNTHVFVASVGNKQLHGQILTINNTSIARTGTIVTLSNSSDIPPFSLSIALTPTNKIIIFYGYGNDDTIDSCLYYTVINTNNYTISIEKQDIAYDNTNYSGTRTQINHLFDDKYSLQHTSGGGYPLKYRIINITDNKVDKTYSSGTLSSVDYAGTMIQSYVLSNNIVLTIHNNNSIINYTNAVVHKVDYDTVEVGLNKTGLFGVTSTECTTNTKGKVWVLS